MWKNNNSTMHGLSDIGPNVPAFLVKLWKLVDDPETDELICWSESGLSFIISAQAQFARELLPLYYKHNNMASFIRQLNMYGFHKIVSVDAGGLKSEKDEMEFAHQCFIKDHPYLLENIKRKLSTSKTGVLSAEQFLSANNGSQTDIIAKVLSDVNNLRGKQESWDAKLTAMKRENEALWRELAIFRQKHLKQEQIINKLIHFIVTIVQPSRNVPLRRRYPLMLNDTQHVKKITKLSGNDATNVNHGSPTGPTIHEIDPTEVLFASPEQSGSNSTRSEFISTDLTDGSSEFVQVVSPESQVIVNEPIVTHSSPAPPSGENPENWLEIELTEDDMITNPLTPIDPAKVNPAVAAATLRQMEKTNNANNTISITVPAIPNPDPLQKKPISEKKVIYLTDTQDSTKTAKKKARKPNNTKTEPKRKLSNATPVISELSTSSPAELLLDLVCEGNDISTPAESSLPVTVITTSIPTVTSNGSSGSTTNKPAKRKLSATHVVLPTASSSSSSSSSLKKNPVKVVKKEPASTVKSPATPVDPFLKLDSLYNGTIDESQLSTVSPTPNVVEETLNGAATNTLNMGEISQLPTEIDIEQLPAKEITSTVDPTLAFGPGSMAVVCQPSSANTTQSAQDLSRSGSLLELNTHLENVEGEIDYLKEVLKDQGYSFDANTLLSLFNDDPLAYGMPPADEISRGKENNSGTELMTYGAPNLMDLIDLYGTSSSSGSPSVTTITTTTANTSSSSTEDWPNLLSPLSPAASELTTPAPSPNISLPIANKRRRK